MSSIGRNFDRVGEQVSHKAAHMRSGLVELGTQVLRLVNNMRESQALDVESLLGRIGLQRRRSAAIPIAWFIAGVVVAGGAALLLAPMKGEDLIDELAKFVRKTTSRVDTAVGAAGAEIRGEDQERAGRNGGV